MTGYFVTLVVGLVLSVVSRLVFWGDLRRARKRRAEPRIGLLAPALFIFAVSGALVVVGVIGVSYETRMGRTPPVPLGVIYGVLAAAGIAMIVAQQRRRMRRRAADRARARRRAEHPPQG